MSAGKKVQCKSCLDIIQSMYRHDFVSCRCGKISIDGGGRYQKVSFPSVPVEDWIEFEENNFKK